jgi:hypothetical protein
MRVTCGSCSQDPRPGQLIAEGFTFAFTADKDRALISGPEPAGLGDPLGVGVTVFAGDSILFDLKASASG